MQNLQFTKNNIVVIVCVVLAIALLAVLALSQGDKDKQTVLMPPVNTPEAVQSYQAVVEKLAKESSTLTLGPACAMDPLVLQFHAGATLTVVNKDTVAHTMSFEDQNFFNVSAGSSRSINISQTFSKGPGVYRYRCNDVSQDNVGVLSIVR